MIRRPPRSTLDRSSAASDVYKRQGGTPEESRALLDYLQALAQRLHYHCRVKWRRDTLIVWDNRFSLHPVSYTHLRAHETVLDLVCRLLLEKKTHQRTNKHTSPTPLIHVAKTPKTQHNTAPTPILWTYTAQRLSTITYTQQVWVYLKVFLAKLRVFSSRFKILL